MLYLISAFTWWAILLFKKNEENYMLNLQLAQYDQSISEVQLNETYNKQRKMILGEGAVFGITIIFGLVLIYRAFKSEMRVNQRLNDFLLSVTHELKTPIAALKLVIKTLSKEGLPVATRIQLLKTGSEETRRLESQVNNILTAAQLEQSYQYNFEVTKLHLLIEKSTKRFKTIHPERNILTEIDPGITVNIDREAITKVLDNLISNAIKYSSADRDVHIKVKQLKTAISINVIDQGQGISQMEMKRIWDKFYRSGNEDTRQSQGTGLGLWLSKKIITAHKGQILVRDNAPQGTIFEIQIPA